MERADPERPTAGRSGSDRLVPLVGAALLLLMTVGGVLAVGGGLISEVEDPNIRLVRVEEPGQALAPDPSSELALLRGERDALGPRLAGGLKLKPRSDGSFVITGDPDLLDAARLANGDLLLESDGAPLGPDGERTVAAQLASLDTLEVTIERDGQDRRLTLLLRD